MELMLAESGERRGQRSFWSLFYWPDQMRNNGGQCHKHWPRYFLFTRNNDSIWAGASDPRTASLVSRSSPRQSTSGCFKQHFHTKSEIKDSDKWIKRMAPLFNFFHYEQSADYSNQADDTKVMILNEGYRATPDIRQKQKQKQSLGWDCETRYGCQAVSPTVKIFLGWHIICNFGQTHGMGPGIWGGGSLSFWLLNM